MKKFLMDDSGATAIEYGLLAALIGSILVGMVTTYGTSLTEGFNQLGTSFKTKATFGG